MKDRKPWRRRKAAVEEGRGRANPGGRVEEIRRRRQSIVERRLPCSRG